MQCDYCDKQAVANYQRLWVRWNITPRGYAVKPMSWKDGKARDLNDIDEPTGENNIHVCARHETALLNGEV